MGEIAREKLAAIEEVGEESIFDDIASGTTVNKMIKKLNIGWRLWYKWVDSKVGRRDRYYQAMEAAGHYYAARAVDTAQEADAGNVNLARLQVDTDKWIASKLNGQYDVRQKDVQINISVNDLHAQAAALLSDVEDAEVIDEGDV